MRRFFFYMRFWECWCEDTHHPGDNEHCPKHGLYPALVRFIAVNMAILIGAVIYILVR